MTRRETIESIRAVQVPKDWLHAGSLSRQWEHAWWSNSRETILRAQALGAMQNGLVIVSCGGCEIKCCGEDVQAAVNHVLAWEKGNK